MGCLQSKLRITSFCHVQADADIDDAQPEACLAAGLHDQQLCPRSPSQVAAVHAAHRHYCGADGGVSPWVKNFGQRLFWPWHALRNAAMMARVVATPGKAILSLPNSDSA